ncbi:MULTISPECIES: Holliday junction resolvase RuvX [Henriciella]|jgi:putative holliday junction resolvase|uniref:Putative pre-16S rRNA nuclease n=1 Tax=Henriciella pelagia TaxID=1977912 RepID=A0ABQ1J8R8_9PROT|nr:Holliday junction resolvase RuvX [Henriciella pelagia]GGB61295.1 putative pre-16S rRNA nuclease [Henriciella pelagia]
MAVTDLFDLPAFGVLIGIDPGSKTLGIAACDGARLIASPVETIQKGRKLGPSLDRLMAIVDERRAVGIVMGLPLNMDGSEGPRVQSARALARNILERRDIPIAFQDERLTSSEAERAMITADLSRARRAELIDASAAAIILQTAIDRLANAS